MLERRDRPEEPSSIKVDCAPTSLRQLANVKAFLARETIIFLFIWTVLMVVGRTQFFLDPGSLWHPVVGEKILETGRLIYTDPFSFTCADQPWIAQWWLGDCFLALLHRAGG